MSYRTPNRGGQQISVIALLIGAIGMGLVLGLAGVPLWGSILCLACLLIAALPAVLFLSFADRNK